MDVHSTIFFGDQVSQFKKIWDDRKTGSNPFSVGFWRGSEEVLGTHILLTSPGKSFSYRHPLDRCGGRDTHHGDRQ